MNSKTLGLSLVGIGIVFGVVLWLFASKVSALEADACGCGDVSCTHEQGGELLSQIGLALVVGTLSLGGYLLFFDRSQQALLQKIEHTNTSLSDDERFRLVLRGLDSEEQKVLVAVRSQDGISQHTLRLRTGMHKSKLSIVLSQLEKKELIAKERAGKVNKIFLRVALR